MKIHYLCFVVLVLITLLARFVHADGDCGWSPSSPPADTFGFPLKFDNSLTEENIFCAKQIVNRVLDYNSDGEMDYSPELVQRLNRRGNFLFIKQAVVAQADVHSEELDCVLQGKCTDKRVFTLALDFTQSYEKQERPVSEYVSWLLSYYATGLATISIYNYAAKVVTTPPCKNKYLMTLYDSFTPEGHYLTKSPGITLVSRVTLELYPTLNTAFEKKAPPLHHRQLIENNFFYLLGMFLQTYILNNASQGRDSYQGGVFSLSVPYGIDDTHNFSVQGLSSLVERLLHQPVTEIWSPDMEASDCSALYVD